MLFLRAELFWNLLWIVPLFLLVVYIAAARSAAIRRLIFKNEERAEAFLDLNKGKRRIRAILLLCSILLVLAAAAGPAWGRRILPDAGPGHDLLILFDVSRSMLSDDVKPDRLAQGKWLVRELVRSNPADRFGLIGFAGNAFLLCPLTIDRTSFLQLSDSLDTDTIPLGGTDLQKALETAIRAFEGAQGNHKAVIVITDGDELTGKAAGTVEKLAQSGIPLFIAGIGDPANPSVIRIKQKDESSSILTDADGNTVKSVLNEPLLSSLAQKTHGIYIRSTSADPGLAELNAAIARLDKRRGGDAMLSVTRPIERPGVLFAVSLVFLLAALCLSETGKANKKEKNFGKQILFFLIPSFFSLNFMLSAEDAAPDVSTSGLAPQPAEASVPQPEKGKDPATFWFNTGFQAQMENQVDLARTSYEKAVAAGENPSVRSGAFQNLGVMKHLDARKTMGEANSLLKQQKLDEAEKKVDSAVAELDEAESVYRESLRYAAQTKEGGSVVKNQQLLLRERKAAEELKKQIEELKKKQEDARKQAQKALNDQRNQQQKKDQQRQQPQNQQQKTEAQNSTEKASQAADQLSQQAQKLSQEQMKKQAEQAKKELQQAMSEQKQGNDRKAEEHLKKAVQALGTGDPQKKDPKDSPEQKKKQDKPQDGQKQDQPKSLHPQPQKQQPQGGQPDKPQDRSIDPAQAEAILNAMERDEKELRDLLKEVQKKNMPQEEPVKNW